MDLRILSCPVLQVLAGRVNLHAPVGTVTAGIRIQE